MFNPNRHLNKKFGDWFIVSHLGVRRHMRFYLCRCVCGKEREIYMGNLVSRKTTGCGCRLKEKHQKTRKKHNPILFKAGGSKGKTYSSYYGMMQRCYNVNAKHYSIYGERGIAVCERWRQSFDNFFRDMGKRPPGKTLDRIDNNGNYEPSNCRWATQFEQVHNNSITYKDDLEYRTDISRQRKYQIRRKREHRCIICGEKEVIIGFCQTHRYR